MSVTLDWYTSEDVIRQVEMQVSNAPKYSFTVSLGSTDVNYLNQRGLAFQKVKFGLWGFSKLEFRQTGSFHCVEG